jgi:uncharacterized protein (TIGR03000 family)
MAAKVNVVVPATAELFVDGIRTSTTGSDRTFITPLLELGLDYTYLVLVRWNENGMPVEQTRTVKVFSGAQVRVDFTRPQP